MTKYLYISDLDGTLFDKTGYLSPFSRRNLINLIENNILFTIASARSLTTIRERLGELPLKLPVIHMNGSWITDYSAKNEYYTSFLPKETVKAITEIFIAEKATFLASGKHVHTHKPFCSIPPPQRRNIPIQEFIDERYQKRDPRIIEEDFAQNLDDKNTISFTLVEHSRKGQEILKKIRTHKLDKDLAIYPMGERTLHGKVYEWTTVQHEHGTKGHGALRVAQQLAIPPKNLIVFGDNVNDYSLLEAAKSHGGTAIAVENSTPELSAIATFSIEHHNTDSVIKYILAKENLKPV
ncbi:hypothetical protein COTS27_00171 [Spirochaetota bacterium]|nr:hypothetical protein COTS27_00171 [Spirochaetota bacterium]